MLNKRKKGKKEKQNKQESKENIDSWFSFWPETKESNTKQQMLLFKHISLGEWVNTIAGWLHLKDFLFRKFVRMNHSGRNMEQGDSITQVTANDGVPRTFVTYICRVYVFFDLELHSSPSLKKIKCSPFLFHSFHKCTFNGKYRQPVENEHVVRPM